MVKTKRVILTFSPTDRNLLILQNTGYLNKRGKTTGRLNLGEFINRAIHEKVGVDDPSQNGQLLEKLLLSEIQAEQKKRDEIAKQSEAKLRELAKRLEEHRNQTKVGDYYASED